MVATDTFMRSTMTQADADTLYPAIRIGPTWQKDENGYWLTPKFTLGYQVIEWITENLLSPDGSGEPFVLTFEQMRFVLWLYAVDELGRFSYRNVVLQRLKGW